MSPSGAMLRSYKDHSEIMAYLCLRDPARMIAAFYHHPYRIYITIPAIIDAKAEPCCEASAPTPEG